MFDSCELDGGDGLVRKRNKALAGVTTDWSIQYYIIITTIKLLRRRKMEIFGMVESFTLRMEEFSHQVDQITRSFSSWRRDERIKSYITGADPATTKYASLTLIVNAKSVISAIRLLTHLESDNLPNLTAQGREETVFNWIVRLGGNPKVNESPVEYQLRMVTKDLRNAKKAVNQFMRTEICPAAPAEQLGPQTRLAFQHFFLFHSEQMKYAFLRLDGLLVQRLDRRFTDLPALIYRIEQLVREVKSVLDGSTDARITDILEKMAPEIGDWRLPRK